MNDPIQALEALEPESPPSEVVLGALRLFRYRLIATVAVAALLIGALLWFASSGRALSAASRRGESSSTTRKQRSNQQTAQR